MMAHFGRNQVFDLGGDIWEVMIKKPRVKKKKSPEEKVRRADEEGRPWRTHQNTEGKQKKQVQAKALRTIATGPN